GPDLGPKGIPAPDARRRQALERHPGRLPRRQHHCGVKRTPSAVPSPAKRPTKVPPRNQSGLSQSPGSGAIMDRAPRIRDGAKALGALLGWDAELGEGRMAMISGHAGAVERKIEALWTSGTLTG